MASSYNYTPPKAALDHFLLDYDASVHLSSSSYEYFSPFKHIDENLTSEDGLLNAFFVQTLATPTTIAHCLAMRPRSMPPVLGLDNPPVHTQPHAIWLLALGRPGLSGHPSIAHGGAVSALLDETMGICVEKQQEHEFTSAEQGPTFFTATLQTTYKKPVKVPANYLIKSWVTKKEGRKIWAKAQVVSMDGNDVFTEGSCLCIGGKRKLAML